MITTNKYKKKSIFYYEIHLNYVLKDRYQTVIETYLAVALLPGVQDDANGSRQTIINYIQDRIINYIQDREESQQPRNKRTVGGRRKKKTIKGRKSRK